MVNENSETDAKVFSKTSFGQHDSEFKDAQYSNFGAKAFDRNFSKSSLTPESFPGEQLALRKQMEREKALEGQEEQRNYMENADINTEAENSQQQEIAGKQELLMAYKQEHQQQSL